MAGKTGPKKGVPLKLNAERRAVFLAALARHGFMMRAAHEAGVCRATVLKARKADPAFQEAYDEALEEYTERLEQEADRRGFEGVPKPIFHRGQEIATVLDYSDTLLIFRLKALRPEMYKERIENQVEGEVVLKWQE